MMQMMMKLRPALCAFALLTPLAALADCSKAVTPVDKSVCQTPELTKQDAELNRLYSALRTQLTPKAKADLLTQQRAWIATRNKECASGDAACLHKQYSARIDQLQALTASASADEGKLNNTTSPIVKGTWKVSAIQDPAGNGHTDPVALKQSLSSADLPAIGATVSASAGKLCFSPDPCDNMAWTPKNLSAVNASAAIIRYLNLTPTTHALVGSSGSKESYYLLIPQPNGTLWAVFALCGPAVGQNCRQAAEVWSPTSPDAAFSPRP